MKSDIDYKTKNLEDILYSFIIDKNKKPLMPCHPARARKLLDSGKAAVFRRYPFIIILKHEVESPVIGLRLKIDPGSKTTGFALLNGDKILWAAELTHRGYVIKDRLTKRASYRRTRRNRKTRYRQKRFSNRSRVKGWLPPSLMSRVYNIMTWVAKISKFSPVSKISVELAKFDIQKMENPEISGVEYQQGELWGYNVREYLLEKWGRKCAYCGKKDIPLQIEHVIPKSRGGTNKVSNLTLACQKCNQLKGNKTAVEFNPEYITIQKKSKNSYKDAAVINATRKLLISRLQELGLPLEIGTGALTKYNRILRGIPKSHWMDAACVGTSTPDNLISKVNKPIKIVANGQGERQLLVNQKKQSHRGRTKFVQGYKTGDMIKANVTNNKLKTRGTYFTKVKSVSRTTNSLSLVTDRRDKKGKIDRNWWVHVMYIKKVHLGDGYGYKF